MNKFLSILIITLLTLTSCVDEPGNRQMLVKDIIKRSSTEAVIVILENNTVEYRHNLNPKWVSAQNLEVGKKYHEKLFSQNADSYQDYVEFELVKLDDNLTGEDGKKVSVGYFIPKSSTFFRLELERVVFDGEVMNPNNGQKMTLGESCLFKGVWGDGYKPVQNISEEEYLSLLGIEPMSSI